MSCISIKNDDCFVLIYLHIIDRSKTNRRNSTQLINKNIGETTKLNNRRDDDETIIYDTLSIRQSIMWKHGELTSNTSI